MKDRLLHTPEGVRDIYNSECEQKIKLQDNLHQVLRRYGFRDIQTPSFEFFEIFSQERGTISSNHMYKLYDRDGNTLVLRPDMTPSVARCVAKYYRDESFPIRLCYMGNTFINNVAYQGKLKEVTQLGAELILDDSVEADGEMIALTIDCLLKSGLEDFQIEIGNAGFFRALVTEAGVTEEDEVHNLRILIENKNLFGVEEFLREKVMNENLKEIFLQLPELFGSLEILGKAKEMTANLKAIDSIERLERIYDILKEYGYERYISFDLAMLSKYDYYTGIIFKAYTYGTGDAIATGGRYDHLVGQFGKEAPAIGLGIVIDQLMIALERQKKLEPIASTDTLIIYDSSQRQNAIALGKNFRRDGLNTILQLHTPSMDLDSYIAYGKRMSYGGILFLRSDHIIQVIDVAFGTINHVSLGEILGE